MSSSTLESVHNHSRDAGENTGLLERCTTHKHPYKCGIRKLKSRGALLTLVLIFLVYGAFFSLLMMSTELHGTISQRKMQYLPGCSTCLFLTLLCPIAGWLADVYFGRYKVMRAGLWLFWLGALGGSVSIVLLTQHKKEEGMSYQVIAAIGTVFGFIVVPIGFSAFAVNCVQFGTDQMPEASADEVCAYIHWLVWALFAGVLVSNLTSIIYYCVPIDITNDFVTPCLQTLIPMTMLSLAVCCDFLFQGWLTIEPETQNPLKTVFGVLKFAATHKRPIGRLAITYSEEERPCRIDFAKEKFRGPYTTEEVEDVKTFFRVIVVIISSIVMSIPLSLYLFSTYFLVDHFNKGYDYSQIPFNSECREQSHQILYSFSTFAVIIIPLYEFLIHPLIRNRVPSMLKRVGFAALLTVILTGAVLVINSVEHALDKDMTCMFSATLNVFNPNSPWVAVPLGIVLAVQLVLYNEAILEFTCAQSPYSMRGTLMGLVKSVLFVTFPAAYLIFSVWHHSWQDLPSSPSCDFYYFLFQFLCAVVGFVVMCAIGKWYKRRQRDVSPCYQAMVESVFERDLNPSNATRKQTEYTFLN